jgi:hypothetical protein
MTGNCLRGLLMAQALVLSCGKSHRTEATPALSSSALASATTAGTSAPKVMPAPQTAEQLLTAWTAALNGADMTALSVLYADRVGFYGQSLTREDVIARKRQALTGAPGFEQQVLGQPSYEEHGDTVRVVFQKHSGVPGAQSDVRASLVLVKTPRLSIREETDVATEKRFSSASRDARPNNCEDAVWLLVDSTPFAKQLYATIDRNLKQFPESAGFRTGGMGPFLPRETEGTFDIWIGVHHPERFENYAVFSVTPTGEITVHCGQCDAPRGRISAPRSAVDDFARLCANH